MQPLAVALCVGVVVAWFAAWRAWRTLGLATLWFANVSMGWGVVMTLLLPWLDATKSFRAPFEDLELHLAGRGCFHGQNLSEPARAMVHYFAARTPRPADADCDLLLQQSTGSGVMPSPPPGPWRVAWEGARLAESRERFRLLEREAVFSEKRSDRSGTGISAMNLLVPHGLEGPHRAVDALPLGVSEGRHHHR
jgi:hypothetical protein